MEFAQEVFTFCQSVYSSKEPVPLRPEQVAYCPKVLYVSLRSESNTHEHILSLRVSSRFVDGIV